MSETGYWGFGFWGTGPWGGASLLSSGASIAYAVATSERTVAVYFTNPVMAKSPIGPNDALNTRLWSIVRADTGEALRVLSARDVSGAGLVIELYTLEKFASFLITHTVSENGINDAAGNITLAPTTADFAGCVAAPTVVSDTNDVRDLLNEQTGETAFSGILIAGSNGDYSTQAGTSLIKKLILRRLTTQRGAYAHLLPANYGVGLQVKELVPARNMVELKTIIEREVLKEPEVAQCNARLVLDKNTLICILTVVLQNNSATTFDFDLERATG